MLISDDDDLGFGAVDLSVEDVLEKHTVPIFRAQVEMLRVAHSLSLPSN